MVREFVVIQWVNAAVGEAGLTVNQVFWLSWFESIFTHQKNEKKIKKTKKVIDSIHGMN